MIAVLAEGALRDGISILERCSQDAEGIIDEDKIRDLVGMPKLTYIKEIVKDIIEKEPEKAIETTNQIISDGKDLDNFVWETIKYIKDTLIYKTTKTLELYSKEDMEFINNLSEKASKERLLNLIYELSELSNSMKISTQKNIIFQTGIIKACMEIEKQNVEIRNVELAPRATNQGSCSVGVKNESVKKQEEKIAEQKVEKTAKTPNTTGKYVPYWQNVLDKIRQSGKMTIYANLIGTKGVLVNDLILGIEFPGKVTEFAKKVIEEHDNKTLIEKIISMEQGSPMQIRIIDKTEENKATSQKAGIEGLAEAMDLPFDVIDE